MSKSKNISFLTRAAVIASLYAVLVIMQNMFPLQTASSAIQIRLAEALSMLCVLTPAAVPGLTAGCFLGNLSFVSVMPFDLILGTTATFISSLLCYRMRKITVCKIPLLSALMPVIINGIIVGGELTVFIADTSRHGVILTYLIQFLTVAAGEGISVIFLGIPLEKALEKRKIFN